MGRLLTVSIVSGVDAPSCWPLVFHLHRDVYASQIKKNTASHELRPSDILIDRFTAWKNIVGMLICEFSPLCQKLPDLVI